ncbi:hypothetical protein Pla175_28120 [Pirellulimonas nuda]|uniref:Uncharacterized protein n=1 Tax=Pirellulimonas nuda TaxID=2528009 RepID=A0A518DD65_9BACT|nr:hypothetical protein [Pirellulimonas nuda]QDU89422.1 hypothetical protein Pla175_28120 [Pirellulimonas nuda]
MACGGPALRNALVAALPDLFPPYVPLVVHVAFQSWDPAEVYDAFHPYLRQTDRASRSDYCTYVIQQLAMGAFSARMPNGANALLWRRFADCFDPRWLDLVVELELRVLLATLARPGHSEGSHALLKYLDECVLHDELRADAGQLAAVMRHIGHPSADVAERMGSSPEWRGGFYAFAGSQQQSKL